LFSTLTALISAPGLVMGQSQTDPMPDESMIEEIIVFATKVARDNQDIPVAVTAVTGDTIEAAGIKDMFDLQTNAPGLVMGQSQTTTTSNFQIRGIGTTSNNFGLESSVGLYVDGVYRSRQSSMINELVDVEAVEILRGPQGTLFGKNTPQGAINMRTVAPSSERNAFVEVTGGDLGLVRLSAASNFSFSEDTHLRATVFSSQRDGYVSELSAGSDVLNDRDRIGGRLQLAYSNDQNFDLRVIADYSEIDEACCAALARVDSIIANGYTNPLSPVPGGLVPGSDFVLFGLGSSVFSTSMLDAQTIGLLGQVAQGQGLPGGGTITFNPYDNYLASYNRLPVSQNEDTGLSVEFNYDFENDITLTSITAYRKFDSFDAIDADFTNTPLIERINDAQQTSLSQELRLSKPIGDRGIWVAGLYYYTQDLDSQKETSGGAALGAYVNATQPQLAQAAGGINAVSAATGGLIPVAGVAFPSDSFSRDDIRQEHDSVALFGQADIPIGERLTLTLGARYTDEEKSQTGTFVQGAMGPPPNTAALEVALCQADPACQAANMLPPFNPLDPATQAIFAPFAFDGWGTYLFDPLAPRPNLNESLSDDQVSGTVKLSWFANESTLLYASYGRGYKSGGTNADRISPLFNPVFGPETSDTIELGLKADFPTRNMRLNIALYDTEVDGLQANSFTGTGFNLQNAGKADTSGGEIEFWWVPVESFSLQAFYVHSNAKFAEFENGTCWDAWVFHNGMADPNSGGDINAVRCSRSGGTLPYNPEDTFFLSATKDFVLGDAISAYVRGEYTHYSDLLTDGDLDPFTRMDSGALFNARVGLHFEKYNTDLVFWGRNLGDERRYAGSFDAPLQDGRMNSYPSEPRTWGITLRKDFD